MIDRDKQISITITKGELAHMINDIIAYCWDLEEKGLNKNDECGYFSRQRLLEKLRLIERAYFPDNTCCG